MLVKRKIHLTFYRFFLIHNAWHFFAFRLFAFCQWNLRIYFELSRHSLFQHRFPIPEQRWLAFISSVPSLNCLEMKNNFISADLQTFFLLLAKVTSSATHGRQCCWLGKRNPRGMSIGICNVALFISLCAIHIGCWHFIFLLASRKTQMKY